MPILPSKKIDEIWHSWRHSQSLWKINYHRRKAEAKIIEKNRRGNNISEKGGKRRGGRRALFEGKSGRSSKHSINKTSDKTCDQGVQKLTVFWRKRGGGLASGGWLYQLHTNPMMVQLLF